MSVVYVCMYMDVDVGKDARLTTIVPLTDSLHASSFPTTHGSTKRTDTQARPSPSP